MMVEEDCVHYIVRQSPQRQQVAADLSVSRTEHLSLGVYRLEPGIFGQLLDVPRDGRSVCGEVARAL